MKVRKPKIGRRKPDLTFELDGLVVLKDKPRGDLSQTSPSVETYYDPELAALAETMKRSRATQPKIGRPTLNDSRIKALSSLLEDCLHTAESIKSKRATELVKLLRVARDQFESIHAERS